MRYLFFVLCLAFAAFGSATAQQVDKAAVKARINRAAMEMKSMECDFVQTKHLKLLSDKMVSKDVLSAEKPSPMGIHSSP